MLQFTILNKRNRDKRLLSCQQCEAEETKSELEPEVYDDDQLLIGRESHNCVYKGFEEHFQKLFDEESMILFQNWTIHGSYGHELSTKEGMDTFVKEMLSFKEIDTIKKDNGYDYDPNDAIREELKNFSFIRMKSYVTPGEKIVSKKLQRIGSFMIPKEAIDRQIFQTAVDVISQSILASNESEDSSDSD